MAGGLSAPRSRASKKKASKKRASKNADGDDLVTSATAFFSEFSECHHNGLARQFKSPEWTALSKLALDIKAFVGGNKLSEPEPEVSPRERATIARAVSEFCEGYAPTRIEPTTNELEVLWASCRVVPAPAVSDAFYEQLAWGSGALGWQPRLRALHALEHISQQGRQGRCIATAVVAEAREILQYLSAEVPQCCERATNILALAKANWRKHKDEDGKQLEPQESKATCTNSACSSSITKTCQAGDQGWLAEDTNAVKSKAANPSPTVITLDLLTGDAASDISINDNMEWRGAGANDLMHVAKTQQAVAGDAVDQRHAMRLANTYTC